MRLLLPNHETTPISALIYSGWALQMRCGTCNKRVVWGRAELAGVSELTVGGFASRARCGDCGSRSGQVITINDRSAETYGDQRMDGYRKTFPRGPEVVVESAAWVGRGRPKKR